MIRDRFLGILDSRTVRIHPYPLDITSSLVWKVFYFIHDTEPKATQMKLAMFRIEFIFSHIDTKASEVVINIVWIKSSRKESGSSLTFKTL